MANTVLTEELTEARTQLNLARNAYEVAMKTGRSWQMKDGDSLKQVSNEDLKTLRENYLYWKNRVAELESAVNGNSSFSSGKAVRIGVLF